MSAEFIAIWYGGVIDPLGGESGRVAGHQYAVYGGEYPGSVGFPQNWPEAGGAPHTVEKALWVVGETPEKPSTQVATEATDWVFLTALRAEMETVPHDRAELSELQGREVALEAEGE